MGRQAKKITLAIPKVIVQKVDNYANKNYGNGFKPNREVFYFIISELIQVESFKPKQEFHNIKCKNLSRIKIRRLDTYIKILRNETIIIGDIKQAVKGERAVKYKLNEAFAVGELVEYKMGVESLIYKKIKALQYVQSRNASRLPMHIQLMRKKFFATKFDLNGAIKWIEDNLIGKKRLAALSSVYAIDNIATRYFNRNRTNGRLDTNFTNLKSELRRFIILEKGTENDLKNSQPYFLSIITKEHNITTNHKTAPILLTDNAKIKALKTLTPSTIKNFFKLFHLLKYEQMKQLSAFNRSCSAGTIYDDFTKPLKMEREEVKEMFFRVFFSPNYVMKKRKKEIWYKKEKESFAKVYPVVYEIIKTLKGRKHEQFSIMLQRMESNIVLDIIAPQLCDEGIIPITIHDSFIVEKKDQARTLEIIRKSFNDLYEVEPTIKSNNLTNKQIV